MITDIKEYFVHQINYIHLTIFLIGMLVVGTILFHLTALLKLPETIATPISGIGALVINYILLKEVYILF
jgi:putative flippase GtrA